MTSLADEVIVPAVCLLGSQRVIQAGMCQHKGESSGHQEHELPIRKISFLTGFGIIYPSTRPSIGLDLR